MRKLKVLELFAGTRSISKAFEARGHECYTIELDRAHENISLYADVLTVSAEDIIREFGYPDVIWASPPCQSYSISAISHHRRKNPKNGNLDAVSDFAKVSDELVKHTLKLIEELQPKYWFIENPRGGMRKMRFMQGLPRYTVTYCFAGETEVITDKGVRRLDELVGQTPLLLTPEGYVESPVREYGEKELMKLVLSRAGKRKEIFVTDNHRWILKNGKIVETKNLRKGDRLAYCKPESKSDLRILDEYVARGFAYGDGYILSTKPNKKGFVMFCGEKKEMIPFFDDSCGKVYRFRSDSDDVLMRYGYPREWKSDLPDASWTDDAKFSWIAGFIAADGSVSNGNSQIMISSASREVLECVRDRCREIGIDSYGIVTSMRKGYCKEKKPVYHVTLMRSDVPEHMILRSKHKSAFVKHKGCKHQARRWSVVSVEATDRKEMTYCAEVPNIHMFTLNDGILTHNCQYGDTRMKPTDLWTNHPNPMFKPMCKNGDPCHERAPRGARTGTQGLKGARERSRIPAELCEHIVRICEKEC